MNRELFFNNDVEATVLGSIMMDNTLLSYLSEYDNSIFYSTVNMSLFEIMKRLNSKRTPIDVVTLCEHIKKNNFNIPITYITDLYSSVASLSNFKHYKDSLLAYYEKREIDKLTREIDYNADTEDIKNQILNKMNSLAANNQEEVKMQDYIFSWYDSLENKKDDRIKTNFTKLDNNFRGFGGGELITIAAYSGIGKTTFALDILLRQLLKKGKISLFSLEVPKEQVLNKLMSNYTNITYSSILNKNLTDKEKETIAIAINDFPAQNIEIYDKKGNLDYIINQIRRDKINKNINIAYVDLVNRVTTREKFSSRTNELGHITRSFKNLAMELDIPIVILAQVNREGEKSVSKRPTVNDIKDSGSIVEDSDTVISLYREREMDKAQYREELNRQGKLDYNSKNPDFNPERVEVTILKARYSHGATFSMKWQPQKQRIQEVL